MDTIFRDFSEKILIYIGIESVLDPYEADVETTLQNPIPIRAIVSDYSFSKAKWTMPSIQCSKIKEVLIEKKHEDLLLLSQKITYENTDYYGWRENSKLQYRKEGAYIRFHMYSSYE